MHLYSSTKWEIIRVQAKCISLNICSPTSTADDCSHKQSQVAVVQPQTVKFHSKLELGLHHVTERPSQTLEELPRDEARAVRDQKPVLVHGGGQHGEEGFVHSILQKSHLIIEVQAGEARDGLGELRELGDGFHRGVLAAVENANLCLSVLECSRRAHHLGHQGLLCKLQRLHVMDDKRLREVEKPSLAM